MNYLEILAGRPSFYSRSTKTHLQKKTWKRSPAKFFLTILQRKFSEWRHGTGGAGLRGWPPFSWKYTICRAASHVTRVGRYVLAAKLHEICNLFHKFRALKLSYQLIGPGIIKVFAELSNNSTPKLM